MMPSSWLDTVEDSMAHALQAVEPSFRALQSPAERAAALIEARALLSKALATLRRERRVATVERHPVGVPNEESR